MAEQIPSFEHEVLEADMKLLAQEIARHKETPEGRGAGEGELLKKAIQTMPPAVLRQKQDDQKKASVLPAYAFDAPPETKLEVEYLLDIAFHHGIGRAVKEANRSPDFVRDTFHDALVKMLSPEVKKRGIL
ncbi:MAG: hypothetical protein AAB897_04245 [Patescibacteria group bacterium]